MASRKIVHKQFNSPIGLYSNQNVQETLDRELKTLNNGAVGIDFDDPSTTRAGNLAKSAVLAALEEEENEKRGRKSGLTRVAWPPNLDGASPASGVSANEAVQQHQAAPQQVYSAIQQAFTAPQQVYAAPQHQAPQPAYTAQQPAYAAPKQEPQYVPQVQPSSPKPRPASIAGIHNLQNQNFAKPLSPLIQPNEFAPSQQHGPVYGSPRGWNHVNSPRGQSGGYVPSQQNQVVAPTFEASAPAFAPSAQAFAPSAPSYQPVAPFEAQQPSNYCSPQEAQPQANAYPEAVHHVIAPKSNAQQPFRGSPLRKEAPITQKPAQVYFSQPGATSLQGGTNSRGDSKWPPAGVKQQSELDNEARRQLALGPVFRPKRVNKDYSNFFAQNALQVTYPGYRVPPVLQNMH